MAIGQNIRRPSLIRFAHKELLCRLMLGDQLAQVPWKQQQIVVNNK
jgi:hypothetical protein